MIASISLDDYITTKGKQRMNTREKTRILLCGSGKIFQI
jgi:hypothetical protein